MNYAPNMVDIGKNFIVRAISTGYSMQYSISCKGRKREKAERKDSAKCNLSIAC